MTLPSLDSLVCDLAHSKLWKVCGLQEGTKNGFGGPGAKGDHAALALAAGQRGASSTSTEASTVMAPTHPLLVIASTVPAGDKKAHAWDRPEGACGQSADHCETRTNLAFSIWEGSSVGTRSWLQAPASTLSPPQVHQLSTVREKGAYSMTGFALPPNETGPDIVFVSPPSLAP